MLRQVLITDRINGPLLRHNILPRKRGVGFGNILNGVEGERQMLFGSGHRDQRHGDTRFDTEGAAIAKEQTREIGTKVPQEWRAAFRGRRPRLKQ